MCTHAAAPPSALPPSHCHHCRQRQHEEEASKRAEAEQVAEQTAGRAQQVAEENAALAAELEQRQQQVEALETDIKDQAAASKAALEQAERTLKAKHAAEVRRKEGDAGRLGGQAWGVACGARAAA